MDIAAVGGVNGVSGAGSSGGAISSALGQVGGALGKNEFLKMLVMQMQNQDPLDPVKNEDMIAQLAQFSSLEQMQNLNQSFTGFRSENAMLTAAQWGGQMMGFEMKDGTMVEGRVDSVWSLDGATYLQIGGSSVAVNDIAKVYWPSAGGTAGAAVGAEAEAGAAVPAP
jgi:flagellar basal-body rod modification protein FlgD